MSILAAIALAASGTAALPACSWDRPGVNPFMGDVVAAVDRYKDIPAATRQRLKARMAKREYDEIVAIRRDEIKGAARYASEIRDMHFGAGSVCGTVSRAKWTTTMEERGLVYCEDGQCIVVPTVCRNVSRITRQAPPAAQAAKAEEPQSLLDMDPTGAGPLAAAAPGSGNAPNSFAQQAGLLPGPAPLSALSPAAAPGFGLGPTFVNGVPSLPLVVSTPAQPTLPGLPTQPTVPTVPPAPSTPAIPAIPAIPDIPALPSSPIDPGLPALPPLPPVPEPGSVGMLLAGLGVVAVIVRRRHRAQRA
ncbi:MAG: MHFG family PEP-CTERM protein [Burkholderiaceae bacterium]